MSTQFISTKVNRKKIFKVTFFCCLAFIGLFGAVVRLMALGKYSLWFDEAWLANWISANDAVHIYVERWGLVPEFFYFTVLGLTRVFEPTEPFLRLFPALCGIGSVFLSYLVAKQFSGSRIVSVATMAMVALSPIMIMYSQELKPYSGDAFFSLLVIYLFERLQNQEWRSRRLYCSLLFAIAIGMFYSHGIIFILGAIMLSILVVSLKPISIALKEGKLNSFFKKEDVKRSLLLVLWTLCLCLFKIVLLHKETNVDDLLGYWVGVNAFPPHEFPEAFIYLAKESFLVCYSLFQGMPALVRVGLPLGLALILVTGRWRLVLYASAPFLIAFAASWVRKYPFGESADRLYVFMAPILYCCTAYGFVQIFNLSKSKYWQVILCTTLLFLLIVAVRVENETQQIFIAVSPVVFCLVGYGIKRYFSPKYSSWVPAAVATVFVAVLFYNGAEHNFQYKRFPQEIRSAKEFYLQHGSANDFIFFPAEAEPAFGYYFEQEMKNRNQIFQIEWSENLNDKKYITRLRKILYPVINKFESGRRLWLVSSHILETNNRIIVSVIQQRCRLERTFRPMGASAHLFVCNAAG